MNGAHDLGGMHGFGKVDVERDEPVFHSEWERRAFAVTVAAGYLGKWNIDMSRYAREQMPAAEYLASTYYEHWLFGLERLLVEKGLLSEAEIETRVAAVRDGAPPRPAATAPAAGARVLRAADIGTTRLKGDARVDVERTPRFKPGDRVRTRNIHPVTHTRLPRYARGRQGVIDRDHGVFVFPDVSATGAGKAPQHCYAVRFEARELWGPSAGTTEAIYMDLWDDHMDPA